MGLPRNIFLSACVRRCGSRETPAAAMRVLTLIMAVACCSLSAPAGAAKCNPDNRAGSTSAPDDSFSAGPPSIDVRGRPEADDVGASIIFDEHLLTDPTHDRDYNGGGEVTFSGDTALHRGHWLDELLNFMDQQLGIGRSCSTNEWLPAHALAVGLLVFTPGDLQARQVVLGDRPYASLFFVSIGRRYNTSNPNVVYDSSLTVGMLGLAAAESVQHALHRLTDSTQPQGWSHQISAGGEPTARYSLARQALLTEYRQPGWGFDSKWTVAASLGTVTETSIALSMRWGRISSPWWAFTPEQNTYVQETQPGPPRLLGHSTYEFFTLFGARFKLRAYNAFLEGQFRDSDLRYSWDGVNHALGEAWAGFAFRTSAGLELQYLARWESPELRNGIGSRSIMWGSLAVSKSF